MSAASSEALLLLLEPDGYYSYLGIQKPSIFIAESSPSPPSSKSGKDFDEDLVKKNYRRLSLRHHPDKPGGDSDTFRLLNRAQKVLLNEKLRQQYDILGIDLDDDENAPENRNDSDDNGKSSSSSSDDRPSTAQGIVHEIATTILTSIIQLGVRTLMLGAVSTIIVRFWWTLYPALGFLGFIGFRIFRAIRVPGGSSAYDVLSPVFIAAGLLLMHHGRKIITVDDIASSAWTMQFWVGETLVISMFTYNSMSILPTKNTYVVIGIAVFSMLAALWFRGKIWNYVIVLGLIALGGIFVALAFPVMELLLEAILNEKLKLVGEKVRHHHSVFKQHYEAKLKSNNKK